MDYFERLFPEERLDKENVSFTLTYAQTIDGSICRVRGKSSPISSPETMKLTHFLRSRHEGILVGIKTLIGDNPSLTTRYIEGKSPVPIILDSNLQIPLTCKIILNSKNIAPVVFCSLESYERVIDKREDLIKNGVVVRPVSIDTDNKLSWIDIAKELDNLNIKRVMVEGGATVITSILQESIKINLKEIVVTISPQYFGGYNSLTSTLNIPKLNFKHVCKIGDDVVVCLESKS